MRAPIADDSPGTHAQLAPGVYWIAQSMLGGKNGVVIGTRAALAIDSGNATADGAASVALIRSLGHLPNRLFLTHGHGDHAIGSSAFPDADVFAHAATPAVLRRHLPNLAKHHNLPNLAADLTWPTVLFSHELTLDLGNMTVRLVSSPGHSEDSAYAYVVEDRILFSGDTAVTNLTPVANDGNTRQLEASLRHMATLNAEALVPGHGPLVTGASAVREALLWPAAYLSTLRTHIASLLKEGIPTDEIVSLCPYDRFVGDHFHALGQRPEKPHRLTATKVLTELQTATQ